MARKKISRPALEATPRHLWLASLGLVSMAGRHTISTVTQTADRASQVRSNTINGITQAQSRIATTLGALRTGIETNASALTSRVEGMLEPLIAKYKPAKPMHLTRRGRKSVVKTVRRVAVKKAAKRTNRA